MRKGNQARPLTKIRQRKFGGDLKIGKLENWKIMINRHLVNLEGKFGILV